MPDETEKRERTMKKLMGVILLALVALPVQAGPYVKLALGANTYDYDDATADEVLDDKSTAASIAAGIALTQWLSAEVEYASFGTAKGGFTAYTYEWDCGYCTTSYRVPTEFLARGVTAWAVGSWEVVRLGPATVSVVGRAGITRARASVDIGGYEVNDTDTGFAFGGGVHVGLTRNFALTAEATQRRLDFDFEGESMAYDPRTLWLGAKVTF